MLFTCEQNDNTTKQSPTTTISPDFISDPIGAALDYFGLLAPDISTEGCAGDISAATRVTAHARTHMLATRTATSAHAESPFLNRWLCCEPQQASGVYPVENLYLVDARAAAPTEFECVLNSNCLLYCCAKPDQTTPDQTIIVEPQIHVLAELRIEYFADDLYEEPFVHACIEVLPDIRDLVRSFNQTVHQESKCSLYDFDTGPPLKNFIDIGPPHTNMRQLKYSRVPEWGDCMAILLDSVLSRLPESAEWFPHLDLSERLTARFERGDHCTANMCLAILRFTHYK